MEDLFNIAALGELQGEDFDNLFLVNLLENPQQKLIRAERYGRFNLDTLTEEEIRLSFRFSAVHLRQLADVLHIPAVIRTDRRCTTKGLEGLCICLRRLVYPNRLVDLEPLFGLSASYLSDIANTMINYVYDNHINLLTDLSRLRWLTYNKLEQYSRAITNRNAPLNTCWGFIDGTARPICRPSLQQQEYFSGHKRSHCIKYQSVVSPDGIICSLMGAYPGRRHDAGILRVSGLYAQLENVCVFPNKKFVLYGDPAYAVQELVISPYRNRNPTIEQKTFNTRMSTVRQAVEWRFGKITYEFAFVDFRKNQKLLLQDLEKMYAVAAIFTNCHTCLYGSQASEFFGMQPPTLQEYVNQ